MNKVSGLLAAVILLIAVLGCTKIAEKVITPGENFTRTNELWSDVPTMDGMTHSNEMDLPFTAKLLIKFALNNLWRADNNNSADNGPISGDWTAYWVYVIGPLAGAAIAVGCAVILRGRGGDPISAAAGSGVLGSGLRSEASRLTGEIEHGRAARREDQSASKDTAP